MKYAIEVLKRALPKVEWVEGEDEFTQNQVITTKGRMSKMTPLEKDSAIRDLNEAIDLLTLSLSPNINNNNNESEK